MTNTPGSFRLFLERLFTRFGLGMRGKLIILFICIKVVPLILLALVAWRQSWILAEDLRARSTELTRMANSALSETGAIAVSDAVAALDARAREDIERVTTDTALQVANFLYARDDDILFAADLTPSKETYQRFIDRQIGRLVRQSAWELSPGGDSWQPVSGFVPENIITSSIEENNRSFHYRPPERFLYETRPLYLEMAFIDLTGQERIKVSSVPGRQVSLVDVSKRENTFVKAETYFAELQKLKPGEIYVSDVIGAYTPSRLIGMYTPKEAAKRGLPYEPEKNAYAGMENPLGNRFKGIVRWAAPVVQNGRVTGYVTLALDHDHLMEFTSHIMPTEKRYTELPDAYEGNYAFIWDHKGRSIVHPRHHSIAGYDPETGDPQVPWLEDRIYNAWLASGMPYADFIENEPTFVAQSVRKKPARDLTSRGLVGLDCRYLNFAPQCTGWFDLTREGGSGSFTILWSGLTKLTTAAAIPYYTGQYAASPRGFGFVTVGAGLDDFHRPATETKKVIDALIQKSDAALSQASRETQEAITGNLIATATSLSVSTGLMAVLVILIAIWMASVFTGSITALIGGISRFRGGERHFRFNAPIKDEMGSLADSFDEMADSIVESVTGTLVITDLDKKILYMNDTLLSLLHTTLAEVLGKPYAEHTLFPEDSKYSPITALLRGTEAEVMYHAPSGRYLKGTASFLTDKDGAAIGYIVGSTDITEIALQQKKVEEQRVLLDTIFSSSPDLIWYKDRLGAYLAVNPRVASVVGKKPEDLLGCTAGDMLPPEEAALSKDKDMETVASRTRIYTEERIVFADGHEETLDVLRTPIFNSKGDIMGILGVARDVSARVAAENELRETQMELKKAVNEANNANAFKSEFLARMSHEIRTPMNAIIGMTNIARRKLEAPGWQTEEVQGYLGQIETSSQHLLGLLNDILDISKIEAGKIVLSSEPFDLPKLVENVATIIRPRCLEKDIVFSVRMAPLEHSVFLSDSLRLRQVLINLLGNAVKFTPECGNVDLIISVDKREQGRSLVSFLVADTGIGMSRETMDNLFNPFEQGLGITRQYGGTGLGLSISQSIVQLLGGHITVNSVLKKGSTFSFSVWLREGDADDAATRSAGNLETLKGKRVLLVDDVDINRIIMVELLSGTGLDIDEASDGLDAVDKFAASPAFFYNAVLMDVQMPRMDGYKAAETIRAMDRPDAGQVAIIAMTANAFKDDVENALAHGMNSHLSKPIEYEKLLDVLIRYVGGAAAS